MPIMMKLRTQAYKEGKMVYLCYFNSIKYRCIEENGVKIRTLGNGLF